MDTRLDLNAFISFMPPIINIGGNPVNIEWETAMQAMDDTINARRKENLLSRKLTAKPDWRVVYVVGFVEPAVAA